MDYALPTPLPFESSSPNIKSGLGESGPFRLLSRFIPGAPIQAATHWLNGLTSSPHGSWIIDSFGASPALPVAAAKSGWRVLVSANNPIQRFLLENFANPPTTASLRIALAELAASRKGPERLEIHVRSFYQSKCNVCNAPIEVQVFIWERNPNSEKIEGAHLVGKIYTCQACGTNGEFPASPLDIERAAGYTSGGLHYARAIERVAGLNDPDRVHAVEAIETYLPRAVYVLFTLINKLDGLSLPPQRKKDLAFLLLHACDQGSSLSGHPAERERPKTLTIPARFRENNLWKVLEDGTTLLSVSSQPSESPVPITVFPAIPPETGGICIFEGPLREFHTRIHESLPIQFSAAVCVLPRPNQAFWTLSALWAGWIWGQDAAAAFKSVLRRRRYDWAWHTSALHAAFENLAALLERGTPFLGLSEENEPGFFGAVITAAFAHQFQLKGLEARSSSLHILWSAHETPSLSDANMVQRKQAAAKSMQDYLDAYGQPANYQRVFMAGCAGLAKNNLVPSVIDNPLENYTNLQTILREALTYSHGFHRFNPGESQETGLYWLRDDQQTKEPLADRLEKFLVTTLIKRPGLSSAELDAIACAGFSGLITPSFNQVIACLASYAVENPSGSGIWYLREEDRPAARRSDLETMRSYLTVIGERLGFLVDGDSPICWKNPQGIINYAFYLLVSAVITPILKNKPLEEPAVPIIVIPGGRSSLIIDKLRHNPRLNQQAQSWIFLKSRHLRLLMDTENLSPDNFLARLQEDPLTGPQQQMRLL